MWGKDAAPEEAAEQARVERLQRPARGRGRSNAIRPQGSEASPPGLEHARSNPWALVGARGTSGKGNAGAWISPRAGRP